MMTAPAGASRIAHPYWGYPADLITLQDGRVLASYGYRRDPLSIRIAVSEDGITWKAEDMQTLRELPLRSMPSSSPNFACAQSKPGALYLQCRIQAHRLPGLGATHGWQDHDGLSLVEREPTPMCGVLGL